MTELAVKHAVVGAESNAEQRKKAAKLMKDARELRMEFIALQDNYKDQQPNMSKT